jgi:DnaK suppressor protein
MIDENTRTELIARLKDDLRRLEGDLDELDRNHRESLSEASGENVYRDHMADLGSATFQRDMDMTFEENEREALDEVRDALARVDAGTYGTCSRCGADIPAARLLAMPTATLCITCKAAEESR